ncbi:hypothetical protein PR202_ga29320 [Eleusine coracana subsp. coracana]|uniref:WPP domain-containing protein n=1 Tax=Eleusine coracana subsp. coracana TaxID=191504 RepID=A0AAV5DKU7_ELECO|nr:hypothetical protein PR202_ga29320 [Eleusine coracana subsp. coracana]
MAEDAPIAAAEGTQPAPSRGICRRFPAGCGCEDRGGPASVAQHLAAVAAHARRRRAPPGADAGGSQRTLQALRSCPEPEAERDRRRRGRGLRRRIAESAAAASPASVEEGIEVLQAYSKEVSRRILELAKSRAAPAAAPAEVSVKEEQEDSSATAAPSAESAASEE